MPPDEKRRKAAQAVMRFTFRMAIGNRALTSPLSFPTSTSTVFHCFSTIAKIRGIAHEFRRKGPNQRRRNTTHSHHLLPPPSVEIFQQLKRRGVFSSLLYSTNLETQAGSRGKISALFFLARDDES